MNEQNNPVSQPTPTNPPTLTKSSSFLVTLLSLLLLLAVAAAGFFAYQTQSLVKQLAEYKSVSSTTPTPLASPEPSAEAVDPTDDWETYTSEGLGINFKFPANFRISEDYTVGTGLVDFGILVDLDQSEGVSERNMFITNSEKNNVWTKNILAKIYNTKINGIYKDENNSYGDLLRTQDKTYNNISWRSYEVVNPYNQPKPIVFLITMRNNTYYFIKMTYSNIENTSSDSIYYGIDYLKNFDQILSTFEFIEPKTISPTPTP